MTNSEQRFWAKVEKGSEAECWLWLGARHTNGYGNVYYDGRHDKAHRVAFRLGNPGVELTGLVIDHVCHIPACVNPAHLRAVTQKQNQENRAGAQRNSASGVRGVRWDRRGWLARLKHNRKHIYVGRFSTIEEAAEAVRLKRIELFTHNDRDRKTHDHINQPRS